MQKLNQEISDTKKQSMGLGKQITTAMGKFLIWSAVTVSYFALVRKLKDVVVQVKAIDDALVELKKVSDLTGDEIEKFTDRAFNLGKTVARTGIDTIKAVTEIKRAGYELSESEYLAKYALMMTNVAEGITDAGEAAKIFVSILKGTNQDVSYASTLLDEMNQISNNAAINFDNLASMTQRIAATLNTLGTDVEHTMGLITGAYEVLQDERVAKGISVIGLRMQGLNEDLEEEAGLQSKVNEALEKYAGISVFDSRTGQLRDYYSVLADLASVWDNISKNAQVYLTTTLAGKNRADVLNALMANWKGVENAIQQATDSLGSADKEQENYVNSISGKLAQLSSAWQDLARNSWDSDWSKGLVDMATAILTVTRYGGGLLPVIVALSTAFIALKLAQSKARIETVAAIATDEAHTAVLEKKALAYKGLTAAMALVSVAIIAIISIVGALKKAEAERQAQLEESNAKIQENIDKLRTQYNRYSELKGEVDSLKEEQARLMAVEEKTAEQKKQLTQITKQLAAAQRELNQYVGEGVNATDDYSLSLLRQMGAAAGEYISKPANIKAYESAKRAAGEGIKAGTSVFSQELGDVKDYAKRLGVVFSQIYALTGLQTSYQFGGTESEFIDSLRKIRDYAYKTNTALAAEIDTIISAREQELEKNNEIIATFEKYQQLSQLYGDINVKAIDNLTKSYQKWTNATIEQKIAMVSSNGELTKNIAAVEALKAKYPEAASEIDSLTSSIISSVEAFKEQDRYLDEVSKRMSAIESEKSKWEESVKARKSEEEYAKLQEDVAKAEKELAEAKGISTDRERTTLELKLAAAKAALQALELADKETEAKKKQLEYEEKVYAVQKAEAELANARNKKVQVFRAGQGMVYVSDYSAVEAAQRNLASAKQSLADFTTTQGMTARKDAAQAAVDKAQARLDAYDEKVQRAEDIAKATADLQKAKQALKDYEDEIAFGKRTEKLQADIDRYNDLVLTYGADKVRAWVDANYSKLGAMTTTQFLDRMAAGLKKGGTSSVSGAVSGATGAANMAANVAAVNALRATLFPELYTQAGVGSAAGSAAGAANVAIGGNATTYQIENVNIAEAGTLADVFREIETHTKLSLKDRPIAKQ
jgi:TP901 family phage tail tape measure protein